MKTAVIINNESFGKGDQQLGLKLMGAFLRKLWVSDSKPDAIIMYNSGVKLVGDESLVIEVLHGLEEQGVEIIACGTCLIHYDLKDKMKIGRMTDMEEIVSIMMNYDKIITA